MELTRALQENLISAIQGLYTIAEMIQDDIYNKICKTDYLDQRFSKVITV